MKKALNFLARKSTCFVLGLSMLACPLSTCFAQTNASKISSFLKKICEEDPENRKFKKFIKHHINERLRIARELNYAPKSSSDNYLFGKKLNSKETFEKIYDSNYWKSNESKSGPGSQMDSTENIRKELPKIWEKYNIKSVLDAPCGDYNWMKNVKKDGITYVGVDIVPKIIEENNKKYKNDNTQFRELNIIKDKLPKSDMIICRDCLQHLSYEDAKKAVKSFKDSGSIYLLVTNYPWTLENWDIKEGDFRPLNLCEKPFNFPECIEKIKESNEPGNLRDKYLYLYKLQDIDIDKILPPTKPVTEIPIAMAFDENYVYPTLVAMTSVMENSNPKIKYEFQLMHPSGLSEKSKNIFTSFQNKYSANCEVNLIDMKDAYKSAYQDSRITTPAYYRLMLSDILPNKDKIIWMDGDTLVTDDLSEMYSVDVEGHYYKALLDYNWDKHLFDNFGLFTDHYICDGVMVANLKELRKDNIVEKFSNFIEKYNDKLFQHDQTVINSVCLDKIGALPAKFALFSTCSHRSMLENYFSKLKSPEKYTMKELENAISHPSLIHCVDKPWRNFSSKTTMWWKYAEKTDYFNEIKEKYLISDGMYVISPSFNKNKAVDVTKSSRAEGAKVQLWNKNNTNAQKFRVTYDKDGYYTITAACSGHRLTVPDNSKKQGVQLCQSSPKNNLCDKWHIFSRGQGNYSIVSAYNGLNMDVCKSKSDNGTAIQCWSPNGTAAQKFDFTKLGR